MAQKVLFVDRDGTLIEEPADHQVDALGKIRLLPGVIAALQELQRHGYRFVIVSNQDGLGSASFPSESFHACQQHMLAIFESQGIEFERVFVCPHLPDAGCECRKPRAGLLTRYLAETAIDLGNSAVVGDRRTDIELAANIGVRGFRIDPNAGWDAVVEALCHAERRATVTRKTGETSIAVTVNLDRTTPVAIGTGIGFFDHMLEQIAKHGGFSLRLECEGDLDVDEHHTVEDSAICLGQALRKALGTKTGIERYGFVLPMDESEAHVSLDLSGRATFRFDGKFPRESVGELATEMVRHFFLSLADSLGAALHIAVTGENAHHMVEACFKCVGRALRAAIRRSGDAVPSTKGTLN